MQKDPVCGMQVDERTATARSSYQGRKVAFCGSECKQKFDKNPESYALGQDQGSSRAKHQEPQLKH